MHSENAPEDGSRNEIAELKTEIAELQEEIEEWAKADKKPCRAKRYRIRIDKLYYVVEVHSMTGEDILRLAGKTPEGYMLSQKLRGGLVDPIAPAQEVEFHRHQIERFQTLARDPTEG